MTNLSSLYTQHIQENQTRVKTILHRLGLDSVIIHSGMLKYMFKDDMSYPYKVNPSFKAWLPLTNNPNCWLILDGESKPKLAFYQPDDFWHSVPEDPTDYWVEHFEILKISSPDDVKKLLPSKLDKAVYIGEFTDLAKDYGFTQINTEEVVNYFHFHRAYKTDYEFYCVREANKIAVVGHKAAKDAFMSGASEFEISLAYQNAVKQNLNQVPYGLIIALNSNGAILHYTDCSHEKFSKDNTHSFLIDAGASFNGYAADITRTYSYRDDEFNELIKRMNTDELDLVDDYKLGENYAYAHVKSHQKIAQILSDFKFIDLPANEIMDKEIVKTFYPHGLGHHLGLQVHDVGANLSSDKGDKATPPKEYPHLRASRVLEQRMVYTVEPGLYFIDTLLQKAKESENGKFFNWSKIEEFKKFGGIRIEDNLILHNDRTENITRELGLN